MDAEGRECVGVLLALSRKERGTRYGGKFGRYRVRTREGEEDTGRNGKAVQSGSTAVVLWVVSW